MQYNQGVHDFRMILSFIQPLGFYFKLLSPCNALLLNLSPYLRLCHEFSTEGFLREVKLWWWWCRCLLWWCHLWWCQFDVHMLYDVFQYTWGVMSVCDVTKSSIISHALQGTLVPVISPIRSVVKQGVMTKFQVLLVVLTGYTWYTVHRPAKRLLLTLYCSPSMWIGACSTLCFLKSTIDSGDKPDIKKYLTPLGVSITHTSPHTLQASHIAVPHGGLMHVTTFLLSRKGWSVTQIFFRLSCITLSCNPASAWFASWTLELAGHVGPDCWLWRFLLSGGSDTVTLLPI